LFEAMTQVDPLLDDRSLYLSRALGTWWCAAVRLRACRPARLGCCHCTGLRPLLRLWEEFPGACVQAAANTRFELGE